MKLLQELLSLREEAIEVKQPSDVWEEGKDSAKTFISSITYMVKQVEDSSPAEYEVYVDDGDKRTLIDTLDAQALEASYTPVRANQKPDAEGFTVYRESTEVEAFKYAGDTCKLDNDGEKETLKKGDYLIRHTSDDEFTYSVESADDFEADFTEKK